MKRVKMTRKRKEERTGYVKPPQQERKMPFIYSAKFNAWFDRVRGLG